MNIVEKINKYLTEEKWSKDVETKWEPPEGFFKGSASSIAKGLEKASSSLKQAMSRLNFYINRAGEKLENKEELEKAKELLKKRMGGEKEEK